MQRLGRTDYPEYAEFGNFVEQFFAEMDHRLKRLKSVVKRIERLPAAPRAAVAMAPTPPVVDSAPIAPSAQAPMTQCLSGLLVLCRADEVSRELVAEFLESLDVDVSIVDGTEGIAIPWTGPAMPALRSSYLANHRTIRL